MADPFDLKTLTKWLEQQPAEKEYDFWCSECCLGQYFTAMGIEVNSIGVTLLNDTTPLPNHFNNIAMTEPHTFGAALKRARDCAA